MCHSIRVFVLGLLGSTAIALAGEVAVPAAFATKVSAIRNGNNVEISFAVSAFTDVEVAALDREGKIVRHLGAGMLGKNAPAPFQPDTLSQQLSWDRLDDVGRPADAGGKIRVRLGSNPRVEKLFAHAPGAVHGTIESLTIGPTGELFVLVDEIFKFGRAEMLVLDRDGKYLRTIMPYSTTTPRERTASVGHLIIDGQREPVVFSPHTGSVYPMTTGLRSQTMAWHPKGYLIAVSSLGTAREHAPPRHLIAFDPNGGAPTNVPFVGPRLLAPQGFLGGGGERTSRGLDRMAVSPDGQYVYVVHDFGESKRMEKQFRHGVYRLKWDDQSADSPWIGKAEAGDDDEHFKNPQGIAVDAEGRLLVCDRGNNRVKVYSAEGKLLGQFAVNSPEQIVIEQKTGRIFVLSRPESAKATASTILAFAPFKDRTASKQFEMATKAVSCMALDASGPAPRLWLSVVGGWGKTGDLIPVTIGPDKFEAGPCVVFPSGGMRLPSFIAADPARNRIMVREHLRLGKDKPFVAFDLTNGKQEKLPVEGTDIALDREGNMYVVDGWGRDSMSRYDPAGKPLPFTGSESNRLALVCTKLGPDMVIYGHRVALNGDIYVLRTTGKSTGKELNVYGADGKLKKTGLIAGMGSGDIGLGLDALGNLYVGMNVRKADQPYPAAFIGLVPSTGWVWWKKNKEKAPWCYPYANPYCFAMGSVFKFGPAGGVVYGNQPKSGPSKNVELANAPAGAEAFKTAFMTQDVRVSGAQWRYDGIGPVLFSGVDGPDGDPGCICLPGRLDADLWGRTYAPNVFRHSVEMIDPAGNLIHRIGRYGNVDDAGPAARDQAYFCMPLACAYGNDRVYVTDAGNHQVVGIKLEYAAEETCAVR
jgi:sugar lactone lactonase YvrE